MKFAQRERDVVEGLVRKVLARPPAERMKVFAAAMAAYRDELFAAHPQASKRVLVAQAEQLGLRVLNGVTSAVHQKKSLELERKSRV